MATYRLTAVRVKWKDPAFGVTSNKIKPLFSVAVTNTSGMKDWPQYE